MEEIPNGTYKVYWWSTTPWLPLEGIEADQKQVSLCDIKSTPKTVTMSFREDDKLRLLGVESGVYDKKTIKLTRKSPFGIKLWEKGKFTMYFECQGIPTYFEWLP